MTCNSDMILTTERVENSAGSDSEDHLNHYLKTANLVSSWSWEKHFHTVPKADFCWKWCDFPQYGLL